MAEEYRNWLEENRKSLQEIDKRMEEIDKLVKEADEFENVDFESFEYRTEKENVIYEKTKEFGRTQFVREIALQINSNNKLEKENEQLRLILSNQIRIKDDLVKKVNKAIEYLENDDNFCLPDLYSQDIAERIQDDLLKILKDSDVDE